jgi:hypothetical protein
LSAFHLVDFQKFVYPVRHFFVLARLRLSYFNYPHKPRAGCESRMLQDIGDRQTQAMAHS